MRYDVAIMRSNILPRLEFGVFRQLLGATALAALLVACAPNITQRGNLPDPELLSRIQPGSQTRSQVADILGSPSSIATFGEEIWYYISSQTETLAFYEPEVTEQKVIAITFDAAGMVKTVRAYGLEDAQKIEPVSRPPPTGGRKFTVFEQLFGNLGRFSKE